MLKKVLICGIGAIGSIYADKIKDCADLKILVDKNRLERYKKEPILFNGKELLLNYVLPDEKFEADLIIIATKYDGLFEACKNIKNFVGKNTLILPLLNGVTSEKILAEKYNNIITAYFIGHSAVRFGRNVTFDGVGKIVFGSDNKENVLKLKEFFDFAKIDYKISDDINYDLWLKFMFNVGTNQPSAVLNMTFGEMRKSPKFLELSKNLMKEVQLIAKAEKINHWENMLDDALKSFDKMSEDGKTSMLQDVLAKRKTEVDMFAGEVINFGKKHNIQTPYNQVIKDLIEVIHSNY